MLHHMYSHGLVTPALALVVWSLVIWAWMVATRPGAMAKAKIPASEGKHTAVLAEKLPSRDRAISDNYNHLMEQPTLFYATAILAEMIGAGDAVNVGLAWTYVTVRVAHSFIQTFGNNVPVRFFAFLVSSVALIALVARTLIFLFSQDLP